MRQFGVKVRWTARFDYDRKRVLNPHSHEYSQMIWIENGQGVFRGDDRSYPFRSRALFVIQPGMTHGLTPSRNGLVHTWDVKFDLAPGEWQQLAARLPVYFPSPPSEVGVLLERIRREGLDQQPHYRELAELLLAEILLLLARAANGSNEQSGHEQRVLPVAKEPYSGQDVMASCVSWIEQHACEDITAAQLAQRFGYSASHLRKLFKRSQGCTIPDFQMRVRMKRAKERLACADCTLKQVAEEVGFKTVPHFARNFKKLEGITPGQWASRERMGLRKDVLFGEGGVNSALSGAVDQADKAIKGAQSK